MNEGLTKQKVRKLPILLAAAAGLFINLMSVTGGRSVLLLGLSELAFTVFYFLLLIAAFNDYSLGQSSIIRKIFGKIQGFLEEEDIYFGVKETGSLKNLKSRLISFFSADKADDKETENKETENKEAGNKETEVKEVSGSPAAAPRVDDLIEIQKEKKHELADDKSENGGFWTTMPVLYLGFFGGIALWRLGRIFTVVPLSFTEHYSYSIVNALLLLFFFCFTVIYLKLRKDPGKYPGDKASGGMLMLLAYVSLLYAAVIGAASVLHINIFAVLQWTFYAASVYLIAALAVNILLSVLKKDILKDFQYTIIPETIKLGTEGTSAGEDNKGFLDSEEVKMNFSLKSLYTVKYTAKILPGIILSLAFILFLSTTVFVVQPHQQAAVFRAGRLERSSIVGEGLHFKLPWPIDVVRIFDVQRFQSLPIGYEPTESMNFLWTELNAGNVFLLLLGNGNETVAVNMNIFYKISDLYSFLKTSSNPEAELSAAAYRALMNRTVNTTLEAFLNVDRGLLSASIQEELSEFSDAKNLGLSVVQVIVENIHPPFEVADVYQRVATAFIEKNTIITNALAEAERMLIDAEREKAVAINNAKAEQYRRVSAAQKEMAVYYEAMAAYALNPRSFRLSKYLNTFEKVIEGNRVFVFSPGTEASIPRSVIGRTQVLSNLD